MKKIASIFITFFLTIFLIVFCAVNIIEKDSKTSDEKIKVIATLFPQYDFVKQIGKEKVDVSLLLTPGTETHTYDPSPKDIIKINESDLFVYTGNYMEPWAESICSSIDERVMVSDVSSGIDYIQEKHDHEDENHNHEYDPHIWLDISNAKLMIDNITEALIDIDSKNEEYYLNNAEEYKQKLEKLDNRFEQVIDNGKRNIICFGDKFSYMYFVTKYSLEYITVYDSCLAESEPSVAKVLEIEQQIKKYDIPVIFYESLSEGKIAKSIAKETGISALVFSSVHTVSNDDILNGATYLSVMEQNLENLNRALN